MWIILRNVPESREHGKPLYNNGSSKIVFQNVELELRLRLHGTGQKQKQKQKREKN